MATSVIWGLTWYISLSSAWNPPAGRFCLSQLHGSKMNLHLISSARVAEHDYAHVRDEFGTFYLWKKKVCVEKYCSGVSICSTLMVTIWLAGSKNNGWSLTVGPSRVNLWLPYITVLFSHTVSRFLSACVKSDSVYCLLLPYIPHLSESLQQ